MSAFDVAHWRRSTFDIYRQVRAEPDHVKAHALWASARREMLLNHPASPVKPEDRGNPGIGGVADYDASFRFVAGLDSDVPALTRDVQTGTDGVVPFERLGIVRLEGIGELDVWRLTTYGGGIFVPMRDTTAGRSSYGAGRYLLDTIKGADLGGDAGGLVIDLNFAYNPSCAYDEAWACPLPGPGNRLDVDVPVGEQYGG
ncbi:DUF1684 domain-containing protein [Demequina aurantiaca]|uniref:DUF1684 domain-containing protein n=1 Tax=Demequina aurantiaca TaxID=676200 RepID=UPI000785E2BA|nr:DUF1684 domain-containing protein [Demequina aurantiaca]